MAKRNRLTRSRNRWILGVCGGIADFLGWAPSSVRGLYVILSAFSAGFPGIIVYVILAWMMPPTDRGEFHLEHFRSS